ncbi:MAG: DUF1559 domain-containing protein [Planctomycetaceae bacterium]|nr:DUF1559 domain-containing protein [Planctomycetaceae bacterium]
MPFQFICPHCFDKKWVDDAYAGQRGPCANCGRMITLPTRTDSTGKGPLPSPPEPSPSSPQTPVAWSRRKQMWISAGLGSVLFGILAVSMIFLQPGFKSMKRQRDLVGCRNNAQKIALALQAYCDTHGTYPPPVINDSTGKPLYSWRVLLLPFLGHKDLAADFNYAEPWDSAQNMSLVTRMPAVFASPASPDARSIGEANYVLITGSGTLFPPTGPLSSKDVSDPTDQTLLVVEVRNGGQSWTQPGDIDVAKLKFQINAAGKDSVGGNHQGGAVVATVDGKSAILPERLAGSTFRALITPSGGEVLNDGEWIR